MRHTKPGNIAIHAVSAVLFFGSPLVAWALWSPWPLIGFAVSGWVGTAGHILTKDGGVSFREATSQPDVPFFVLRMFWRILTGKYREDVAQATEKARAPA